MAWRRTHPDQTFADWNRIVAKRAIVDYVREVIGTTRVADGELTPKRLRHELQYVAENALVCLPQADATSTGARRAARPGPSEEEGKLARSMRRLAPKLDAERTRVEALWTTVRCQISELAELTGPRGIQAIWDE